MTSGSWPGLMAPRRLPVMADCSSIDRGSAGASSQREYERRKGERESRVKARFGRRLGALLLAASDEPQTTRVWALGSEGERALAAALATVDGIEVIHDRRVPGTRANIDHIVIGPAGVFVVDAKAHAGNIRVRDVGGLFKKDGRLFVGRRDCSRLADDMGWQVAAVRRALTAEPGSLPPITPVLCFVNGEWPLLRPADNFRGVRLESTRSIRAVVTHPVLLDADAIRRLTTVLARELPVR